MEKVIPDGVNILGYKAEISPVFIPLMGRALASAFTAMTAAKRIVLPMLNNIFDLRMNRFSFKQLSVELVTGKRLFLYCHS